MHALLLCSGLVRHSPHFSLRVGVSHHLRLLLCSPLPPTASLLLQPSLHVPSALSLYSLLFLFPFSPLRRDAFTYPPLFRTSPPGVALALATHSLKFLGARAASQDRVLGAALLGVFARCGRIASRRRVFDRIVQPDLPAWNALLSAYARRARHASSAGSAAEVLDLFWRMVSLKVRPNEITLVAVIGACGELGALGHGVWAHAYAIRRRFDVNCFVATALVEMHSRCGGLDLAGQVFAGVADVDMRCYNAMLQGLAVHGHGCAVLALYGRMRGEGVPVDSVTVLAVMCACAHAGLVDEGQRCFNKMEFQFGIAPRIEHYGCMVLGNGHSTKCRDIQVFDPGLVGLMAGTRREDDWRADSARARAQWKLRPAVFYARMSRWEDAKKARKEMKAMGIDKSPGSSVLDIDGILHEFLTGGKTHPDSKDIYAMVEETEARLSECGHRPSTTEVLFDVDEEGKADALSYHSERVAIAFALMASSPGAPIRIISNLRVCSDCHESAKLVSRVYGGEIVTRDQTRFHHFRDGLCSCRDFW